MPQLRRCEMAAPRSSRDATELLARIDADSEKYTKIVNDRLRACRAMALQFSVPSPTRREQFEVATSPETEESVVDVEPRKVRAKRGATIADEGRVPVKTVDAGVPVSTKAVNQPVNVVNPVNDPVNVVNDPVNVVNVPVNVVNVPVNVVNVPVNVINSPLKVVEVPQPEPLIRPTLGPSVPFHGMPEEKPVYETAEEAFTRQCWAEALLAMTPAPWEEQHPKEPEEPSGCDHDLVFNSAVGTVCQHCGWVKLHIRDTFEFRKPYKRRAETKAGAKKKQKTGDGPIIPAAADAPETSQEVPELVPLEQNLQKMHPHQKEGFAFICKNVLGPNPGGVTLAHAPGTGKTFVVVSFIQSYLKKYPGERVLISTPKIILHHWEREFKKWKTPEVVIPVYHCVVTNQSDMRMTMVRNWASSGGVLLISHQLLAGKIEAATDDYLEEEQHFRRMLTDNPSVLVVDEAHYARNEDAHIVSALDKVRTRRRIFLSGTIFQNNFEELFSVFKLCRRGFINCPELEEFVLGQRGNISDMEALQQKFFRELSNKIWAENGSESRDGVVESVKLIRRQAAAFLSWNGGDVVSETLPGLRDFVVVLNLKPPHLRIMKETMEQCNRSNNALNKDHKQMVVAIHPCFADDNPKHTGQNPRTGVKTAFVMELIRHCNAHGEKLIVFSQRLDPLYLLKDMINTTNWGGDLTALVLDGKALPFERQRVIDDFNLKNSSAKVLLGSIKACGEGISLVSASRVVILDVPWNPSIVRQALCRAYRIGQTKRVYVYRLLAAETDEFKKHLNSMRKELVCSGLLNNNISPEDFVAKLNAGNPMTKTLKGPSGDRFLDDYLERQRQMFFAVHVVDNT